MSDLILCTSENCPMLDSCARKIENDCLCNMYNFEYTCNENSGFFDFIKINSKKARKINGFRG